MHPISRSWCPPPAYAYASSTRPRAERDATTTGRPASIQRWIPGTTAGGGHQLREMGCIFADHMTGPQARIELMLALGAHPGAVERIREVVEAGRYDERGKP